MSPNAFKYSRGAAIPANAPKGFTSAAFLMQGEKRSDGEEASAVRSGSAGTLEDQVENIATKKAKKSRKTESRIAEGPESKLSKSQTCPEKGSKKKRIPAAEENQTIEKPRVRKKSNTSEDSKCEKQTKIRKPKITKVGIVKADVPSNPDCSFGQKRKRPQPSVLSTLLADGETTPRSRELLPLELEEAVKRRTKWTPIRDTNSHPSYTLETSLPDDTETDLIPTTRFGALLGDYGFSGPVKGLRGSTEVTRATDPNPTVKKTKIDFVSGLACPLPPAENVKRSRSPKKKPQTITEKATAPFGAAEIDRSSSLVHYLDTPPLCDRGPNLPKKPKVSATVKKASKSKTIATKAKKAATTASLLPPEAAMKKARDQELVFGTSSQLARDESPTFLRDLQQALKESDSLISSTGFQDVEDGPPCILKPGSRSVISNKATPSLSLWSAGARDLDEALLEAEFVDLTKTPVPHRQDAITRPEHSEHDKPHHEAAESFGSNRSRAKEPAKAGENASLGDSQLTIPPVASLNKDLNTDTPQQCVCSGTVNLPLVIKPMPNYKGFTDAQLNRQVASYGFKKINQRETKIALLEECWKSKTSSVSQMPEQASNGVGESSSPKKLDSDVQSPVKKKRGRKPNDLKVTHDLDATSPKKPRGRPRKDPSSTASPPKKNVKAKSIEATVVNVPNQSTSDESCCSRLLTVITSAVKAQPPTCDPRMLSFHERMLMYEPIVIEDLAVWLNKEGLNKVGEDDEVGVELVKEWCEAQSVCCLWKENLKGGQRGRW